MLSDSDARRRREDQRRSVQVTGLVLSNDNFPGGSIDGTAVGFVTVQTDGAAFVGDLHLDGKDVDKFKLNGAALVLNGSQPAGTYQVNVTADPDDEAVEPYTAAFTITGLGEGTEPPPDVEEPPDVEPPPDIEEPPVEPPPTHVPGQPDKIQDGKTLQQLVDPGGTVNLPPGKFWGVARVSKETTVQGNGTHLTAEGLATPGGKGMFETSVALTLIGLSLSDVVVNDQNGAAVRSETPAPSLTLRDCEVTNCQDGILTSGERVVLENCFFHDNGAGDGQSHEIYVSNWANSTPEVEIRDSRFFCGQKSCHAVKLRAVKATITGSHLKGCTNPSSSVAGTVLDFPDGGEALVENTTIESMPGTPVTGIIGYGMESANFGANTLTLRNVTIVDGRGNGGSIDTRQAGAKLVLENCKYTGDRAPATNGWASVSGSFTKA
jgi:hypothetical protein